MTMTTLGSEDNFISRISTKPAEILDLLHTIMSGTRTIKWHVVMKSHLDRITCIRGENRTKNQ